MEKEQKQKRKVYARGEERGQSQQKMITFRLDAKLLSWLNSKPNKGRYINNLIADDIKRSIKGDI